MSGMVVELGLVHSLWQCSGARCFVSAAGCVWHSGTVAECHTGSSKMSVPAVTETLNPSHKLARRLLWMLQQRLIPVVSIYFVTDSFEELYDRPLYLKIRATLRLHGGSGTAVLFYFTLLRKARLTVFSTSLVGWYLRTVLYVAFIFYSFLYWYVTRCYFVFKYHWCCSSW
jgi:hypothetical protein